MTGSVHNGNKASHRFRPFLTRNVSGKYLTNLTLLELSFKHISFSLPLNENITRNLPYSRIIVYCPTVFPFVLRYWTMYNTWLV